MATTSTTICSSSSASIRCHQILSPPAQQLVFNDNNNSTTSSSATSDNIITYVPTNQVAWHCTFSCDGNYLAACFGGGIGYEPTIRIWKKVIINKIIHKPTTNEENKKRKNKNQMEVDETITTETITKWELYTTLSGVHERTIRCIAFAPLYSQLILASASFDGTIAIWEEEEVVDDDNIIDDNKKKEWICSAQLEGHENEVKCVAWNASGSLLASCGRDKTVWIWECYLQGSIGGGTSFKGGATGGNNGSDFECLAVLNGHTGDVKCVMFAPSYGEYGDAGDEILLSSSYDDTIICWAEDASTGDWYNVMTIIPSLETISSSSSTIWTLALAPSGTRLLSGSADGTIAIYKSYSDKERKVLDTITIDNTTSDNNTRKNKNKKKNEIINENGGIWKCVGMMPTIYSDSDNNSSSEYPVYSISYASTKVGHCRVATCGGNNTITIYREATSSTSDNPVYEIECTSNTTAGLDTNQISNSDDNCDYEYNIDIQLSVPTVDLNCVCWHPTDGSILASASDDGVIRIWNYSYSS
jgi:cytosolic iron-sulfur protein assembly protein CIAO1